MSLHYFPVAILFAMLSFVLSGCGGNQKDHPDLGQVTGVVTLDGSPLAEAVVEFLPVQGRPSNAITDAAGRYKLLYTSNTSGALIGTHSVRISTERYVMQPNGSPLQTPEKLPAKYNKKSTLSKEVKSGSNQFDFELTSK